MPQVFHVLCCYNCNMFQVHIVKKAKKWQCKVCNEKQSLKKAFKIGSALECRYLVQELNLRKAEMNQSESDTENFSDSNFEYKEYCLSSTNASNEKLFEVSSTSSQSALQSCEKDVNSLVQSEKKERCLSSFEFDDGGCAVRQDCLANVSVNSLNETSDRRTFNPESVKTSTAHTLPGKHPIEDSDNMSTVSHFPPVKKNRGFLLIKDAASKLP